MKLEAKTKKLKEHLTGLMRGLSGVLYGVPDCPEDSGDREDPEGRLPA